MASKRLLKKSINNLTYELVSECFTYRNFHPDQNSTGINEIIQDVVKTRNDLIIRMNKIKGEGKEKSAGYSDIVKEMQAMVSKLDKIESTKK